MMIKFAPNILLLLAAIALGVPPSSRGEAPLIRSNASGPWSSPATWEGGRVPSSGERVQIRSGHKIVFDSRIEAPIRSIHIAGTLEFDPERDTLLTVGLIRIKAGENSSETDLDVHGESHESNQATERPGLIVGSTRTPIASNHKAIIRLALVEGLDPEVCPAIVCHGGRMDFHGAPVHPTWIKLGQTAEAGATQVVLDQPVQGWRVGDRVIVTATFHPTNRNEARVPTVRQAAQTEERTIQSIDGSRLTLDAPLSKKHAVGGEYRGEVALLSRNVVVESADPGGVRGHTMYHRDSAGSISFAEFRHLGKAGKLGKYSLHFHKAGDSMRGTSVVGASIWDSGNRWITIHATNRLVIRDCVGYQSVGHGFFLEDGTEVDNILDGNLAVQALSGAPLPGQALAFDRNDGAGFWWANSRNAFVRNVAVECDTYGFRLDAPTSKEFDPVLQVRGPDGKGGSRDIRLEPFLRFDSNEAHSQRRYGVSLNSDPEGAPETTTPVVGPDSKHPLAVRNLRIWDCRWAFSPAAPGMMVDNLTLSYSDYGFWKPRFERQSYRNLKIFQVGKNAIISPSDQANPSATATLLNAIDDRPPVGVITDVEPVGTDRWRVLGTSADDDRIKAVLVNGRAVHPLIADYSRWEVTLEASTNRPLTLVAVAEDASGHLEVIPHVLICPARSGAANPQASGPVHPQTH